MSLIYKDNKVVIKEVEGFETKIKITRDFEVDITPGIYTKETLAEEIENQLRLQGFKDASVQLTKEGFFIDLGTIPISDLKCIHKI